MHYLVIIFLPSYEQFFLSFKLPAIIETIHLNVNEQQNVLCQLKFLALQIVLDFVKILHVLL